MAWGEQFWDPQTGSYQVVGQNGYDSNPYVYDDNPAAHARDPVEQKKYWDDWKATAARRGDPNAKYLGATYVAGTRKPVSYGEGDQRGWEETPGYWQEDVSIDPHATVPKALWYLLDDPKYNGKAKWGTKGQKILGGMVYSKEDPRKSGVRLNDPNQVGYDPEYGYFYHQDNIYQKKHWQDKVAKWAPTAIMALGTMGMSWPAAMAMNAGTSAMRGMAEGQKFGKVLKNVGINAAASLASRYVGDWANQTAGGGLGGWAAKKAIGEGIGMAKRKLVYPGRG